MTDTFLWQPSQSETWGMTMEVFGNKWPYTWSQSEKTEVWGKKARGQNRKSMPLLTMIRLYICIYSKFFESILLTSFVLTTALMWLDTSDCNYPYFTEIKTKAQMDTWKRVVWSWTCLTQARLVQEWRSQWRNKVILCIRYWIYFSFTDVFRVGKNKFSG